MATTACPYCGVEMEVPSENVMRSTMELTKDNALGAKTFVMLVEICPNLRCRKILSVPDEVRGKLVRCQHCLTLFRVPESKRPIAAAAGAAAPSAPATGDTSCKPH